MPRNERTYKDTCARIALAGLVLELVEDIVQLRVRDGIARPLLLPSPVVICRARGSERAGGATREVQAGRDRAKVCQLREHWGYRPTTRGPYILSRRSRDGGNDKIRSDWGEEVRMGRNKERWISKVTNEGVSKANERARRYIILPLATPESIDGRAVLLNHLGAPLRDQLCVVHLLPPREVNGPAGLLGFSNSAVAHQPPITPLGPQWDFVGPSFGTPPGHDTDTC